MRYLYNTLFTLAIPFILLRLWWRSRKNPSYRKRIAQRFGFIPLINKDKSLWLHAVSLGESIAATPLIHQLIKKYQDHTIVVTTTTPTGANHLAKEFGQSINLSWMPFDLPSCIKRFIRRTHPDKVVIMETELWPNMLHFLKKNKIPVMIANARLSERSFSSYHRLSKVLLPYLQAITVVAAQSKADQQRFSALGINPEKVVNTGNIKFDTTIGDQLLDDAHLLKQHWQGRPCFIAASTHTGEEDIILAAFKTILVKQPNTLLIMVPRHPERFTDIKKRCQQAGYQVAQRSKNEIPQSDTQIYLGDTLGELKLLYACSDLAFVGGSLTPVGGHNLIEPASLSIPILSGPHLENFMAIRELLQDANALVIVKNAQELAEQILCLFSNEEQRHQLGARALSVSEQNRGAINKQLYLIKSAL